MIIDNRNALMNLTYDMDYHADQIARGLKGNEYPQNEVQANQSQDIKPEERVQNAQESERVNLEESVIRMKEDEKLYQANAKTIKIQNDTLGSMLDLRA